MKKVIPCIFLLVTGCVTPNFGNQNLSNRLAQQSLTPGITTKQEVVASLGKPQIISFLADSKSLRTLGAKELWNYVRLTREGSTTMSMTILSVYLDGQGIVLDYVVTQQQP